jgi:DNA-binding transcriptional MocR family regulator
VARLARLKTVADLGSPVLPQLHAAHLLAYSEQARAERRTQLTERLDRITNALARQLPDWIWTRPVGGTSLWVELPQGGARSFAQTAFYHGVAIVPGDVCAVTGADDRHIRLSFGQTAETLDDAVETLRRAWTTFRADQPQPAPTQPTLLV